MEHSAERSREDREVEQPWHQGVLEGLEEADPSPQINSAEVVVHSSGRQEGLEAQEERHQHRQKRIETLGRLADHQTPSFGEWLLRED
jgi:hypothetical protein